MILENICKIPIQERWSFFKQVPSNFPSPSYTTSSDTVTIEGDCIEIDVTDACNNEFFDSKYIFLNDDINSFEENDNIDSTVSTPKRKKIMDITNIFDNGLEGVLNNTIDGKIVLLRKHNLNNDARQRLVKEIINYLIGKLGVDSVKAFMLEYAADEISKIFPNEVRETYYIPYLPKSPSVLKKAAQGKLWSRFVNVRSAIKTAENSVKKDKGILTIKDYPNKDAEIELLNTIIEPKDKVVALWRDTYEQRRLALRSSSVTVQELFDRYAALSTSMGPELVDSDFNVKFGDKTKAEIIYSTLPEVANAILSEAKNRKICVVSEENIDPILKALLTLPYLFTPITLKNKRKSGNWRPSRSEVAESFFLQIDAERLADYGRLLGGSQPALDGRQRDLDRIQDLFPHDYLGLHISEPSAKYSIKTKSFRKKSLGDLTIMESNRACTRIFLMEAPCAMSPAQMHLNAKPRHLFLFSDLLLVAKPRSGGSFKLKESVRVSELWMAPCAESETGFLLGWPSPARTYLVTFCTQAARDSWWRELRQALSAQLRLEPPVTNIKVVYRDPLSGTECSKTLGVGPETSSTDVARLALDESRTCDISYTLYTRDRDNAPCPLLGCERPHSIQLARLRQSLCAEEGFDLQHCNKSRIPCDIVFELRPTIKQSPRKTPLKLFRKQSCGRVFGVPLSRLCANNSLPPVILSCLRALFQRGPHTQGIFRRCASARALRELKEKADSQGAAVCEEIANTPALLLGALLKDFLRCLPEPLLCGNAQEWLNAATSGRLDLLRRLLSNLPRENHMLLRHVICVLYNIANRSRFNLMSAANLGVCVGPSMLWESMQNAPLRTLPTLIETLINNCQALFGSQIVSLLGEVANDSGAEESDSLHSLGLSLDSVELSKDQKSLSRDSGLTLSEDDRESPGLNYHTATFHRSDWARQAARMRSMDNTTSWIEEDEAFCASNESLCSPPIPPRRPPPLRHLPPVHIPPMYRPPPPPPPTYATARLLLVTDAESESYV